ncbi:MAG: histidinol-phosphate aminotransferase family protein [Gemmatimonadetes bacterium]|nr:histidinol-phosphate aminotransferase family protein [Gemmatimonadota bacterium]
MSETRDQADGGANDGTNSETASPLTPRVANWTPRAAYRDVRAYDVDPTACELELADNTSPFGAPPAALRVLSSAIGGGLARYPSTYSRTLREAIAAYVGVSPDEVMVGCGSDDVMSCAFRALGEPGDRVAYMDPTFVMARVFAAVNSLTPVPVPLTAAFDADAEALVAAQASITYLCTPNNPTGLPIAPATLAHVLREAHGLVFVDEAYAEFAGTNLAREAPAHGQSLVFRTFSKAFGLAGMRVGFAVGARPLIAELEKARGPFAVTALSERAALAAVTEDLAWVQHGAARIVDIRERFIAALHAAGLSPLNSAANFVLLPVSDSRAAMRALRDRGILVRHFTGLSGIGDALRISLADWPVMERVHAALLAVVPHDSRPLTPGERVDA